MKVDSQISGLLQTALLQPKTGLTHLPLANPQDSYYRSKIMCAQTGINPLLTAAAALLILITKLKEQTVPLDTRPLYQELVHEIRAFETQAQTQSYRTESILIARYILCAVFDEFLAQHHEWQKHKLLSTFHGEEWGGERFFIILERLSTDPVTNIDVLELIYLCLSQGYLGKYQDMPQGKAELDDIIEKLYESIQWQRGNLNKRLVSSTATTHEQTTPLTFTHHPLPAWLLISFTSALLLILYSGFNFMLGSNITPLYQQLNSISESYADN